jgi:hypothetical protein
MNRNRRPPWQAAGMTVRPPRSRLSARHVIIDTVMRLEFLSSSVYNRLRSRSVDNECESGTQSGNYRPTMAAMTVRPTLFLLPNAIDHALRRVSWSKPIETMVHLVVHQKEKMWFLDRIVGRCKTTFPRTIQFCAASFELSVAPDSIPRTYFPVASFVYIGQRPAIRIRRRQAQTNSGTRQKRATFYRLFSHSKQGKEETIGSFALWLCSMQV